MASITGGSSVIAPAVVLAFSSQRPGGAVVRDVPGRANPDATVRTGGLRSGRIKLGFLGATAESDSFAAEAALASPALLTYVTDPGRPSLAMTFVVPDGGTIERALDDVTRAAWTVEFDYREVLP